MRAIIAFNLVECRECVLSAYFSYLVDELADIEERLGEEDVAPYAAALRRAIGMAHFQARLADRAQRIANGETVPDSNLGEQAQNLFGDILICSGD